MRTILILTMLLSLVAPAAANSDKPLGAAPWSWGTQPPAHPSDTAPATDVPAADQAQSDPAPTQADINKAAWALAEKQAVALSEKLAWLRVPADFKIFSVGPFLGVEFATRDADNVARLAIPFGAEARVNPLGTWDISLLQVIGRVGGLWTQQPQNFANYRSGTSPLFEVGAALQIGGMFGFGAGWSMWQTTYDVATLTGNVATTAAETTTTNGGFVEARLNLRGLITSGRCRLGQNTTYTNPTSLIPISTKDTSLGSWCGVMLSGAIF